MSNQEVDNSPVPYSGELSPKLTEWTNEPDVAALKLDLENGKPFANTHQGKVNTWLDNLHMKGSAAITKVKGRSSVQPKLIRKHAEWRYTDLSEPFLSSEKIFTVAPRSHEDRPAAQQNEMLLNWQFDTKLDKVNLVDQMVRTAVDEGSVILQTGWLRQTEMVEVDAPTYAYYPLTDPAAIEALTEAVAKHNADAAFIETLHPETAESIRYTLETGVAHRAQLVGSEKVKQEKVLCNHPTVDVANIFNFIIDPTCGTNYSAAKFMGYSVEMSSGDLRTDKRYKNLAQVNWGNSPLAEPDHVRPGQAAGNEFNFADKSRKLVVVQFYWGLYDIDGTGILRQILAAWIGNTMVRMELNPFPDEKPPFVIIPLLPMRNNPFGEPEGELLFDNQKIIGAVTRGMIDLFARSANAQRGMAKNMLDVVNRRRFDNGQDYEFNPNVHPSNGIVEHKFPEIPMSAPNMVSMQQMEAESLTGIKTFGDSSGLSGASLGPTAAGARGVLSATGRRTNGILRRLAKGMAEVGVKIAAMNQVFLTEKEVVRVTNEEFVTVRRDDLKGVFDLKVDIATAEEDEAKAGRLEFMHQTLGPSGDPEVSKIILSEIARLRRMPDLAYKIKTFVPKPDPMQQRKLEAEIRKLEAEVLAMEAKAARDNAEAERASAQARLMNSGADLKDLDFVEQETGTKHGREMEKSAGQARGNIERDITQSILNQKNGTNADGKPDTSPTPEKIVAAIDYNARQE